MKGSRVPGLSGLAPGVFARTTDAHGYFPGVLTESSLAAGAAQPRCALRLNLALPCNAARLAEQKLADSAAAGLRSLLINV